MMTPLRCMRCDQLWEGDGHACPQPSPCPSCGQPKGQGYGCAVLAPSSGAETELALPSIEDVAGKFDLGYSPYGKPDSVSPEYLALLEAVAQKAAEWRYLTQGTVRVPLHDQLVAIDALCDALDNLQSFRDAKP